MNVPTIQIATRQREMWEMQYTYTRTNSKFIETNENLAGLDQTTVFYYFFFFLLRSSLFLELNLQKKPGVSVCMRLY